MSSHKKSRKVINQMREEQVMMVCRIYDEKIGEESIIAGTEDHCGKWDIESDLLVSDSVQVGQCYLFSTLTERSIDGIVRKVITNIREVPSGAPLPHTIIECSGVAVTAFEEGWSEPRVMLMCRRNSTVDLELTYYWDALAHSYADILKLKTRRSTQLLHGINVYDMEQTKEIGLLKCRLTNTFYQLCSKFKIWELIRYRDFHLDEPDNWRDYFSLWLERQKKKFARNVACTDVAAQEYIFYEEGLRRCMISDISQFISILAAEELKRRGVGFNNSPASRAVAAPGDEDWEFPRTTCNKNKFHATSAWYALWKEALGGKSRQTEEQQLPPESFSNPENSFVVPLGRDSRSYGDCIVFKLHLKNITDLPFSANCYGEHVKKKWVPLSELEAYMRPEQARILQDELKR